MATKNGLLPISGVLSRRTFAAFLLANALGFTGEYLRVAAQSWWILDQGGSKSMMGAAGGLKVVPAFALALFAGVLIDRVGGRKALMLERGVLAVLAIITAALLLSGDAKIWHIVVLSVIAGSTIALGHPATESLVPELVPEESRQVGNSLNQLAQSAGRTAGPLVAGVFMVAVGAGGTFVLLAIIYVIAMVSTAAIRVRPKPDHRTEPFKTQFMEGIAYLRSNRTVLWLVVLNFSLAFFTLIFPLIPIYADEELGVGTAGFAWLMASIALGQGTGAVMIIARGGLRNKRNGIILSAIVFDLGILVFAVSSSYMLSAVVLFGMGMAIPVWTTSVVTLVQNNVTPEVRGRVMAVYSLTVQGLAIAWLLGGWLADTIGNQGTLFVAVVGSAVMVGLTLLKSPELRSAR